MATARKARPIALGLAVGLLAPGLVAPEARADERVECATAYEYTQRAQQRSELMAALDAAERCAKPSCPAILTTECTRWVTEIQHKLPGLVVRVRAADGCPRDAGRVEIVGATRKSADSDMLYVEPGVHEVKVTDSVSGKTKTETIDFAAGERRDIDVDFAPPELVCGPKQKAPPPAEKIPRPSLLLGAGGAGLIVIGGALGLVGVVKRSGLDDCRPNCSNDRLDAVRPFFIAGDIVAALGLLTFGAAVVTYFALDRGAPRSSRVGVEQLLVGAETLGVSF